MLPVLTLLVFAIVFLFMWFVALRMFFATLKENHWAVYSGLAMNQNHRNMIAHQDFSIMAEPVLGRFVLGGLPGLIELQSFDARPLDLDVQVPELALQGRARLRFDPSPHTAPRAVFAFLDLPREEVESLASSVVRCAVIKEASDGPATGHPWLENALTPYGLQVETFELT